MQNIHWLEYIELNEVTNFSQPAFTGFSKLSYVSMPKYSSVFDGGLFMNCSSLSAISLPNVSYIGAITFMGCTSLKEVYLMSSSMVTVGGGNTAFSSTPIASGNGSIYVPSALVDSYKSNSSWALVVPSTVFVGV